MKEMSAETEEMNVETEEMNAETEEMNAEMKKMCTEMEEMSAEMKKMCTKLVRNYGGDARESTRPTDGGDARGSTPPTDGASLLLKIVRKVYKNHPVVLVRVVEQMWDDFYAETPSADDKVDLWLECLVSELDELGLANVFACAMAKTMPAVESEGATVNIAFVAFYMRIKLDGFLSTLLGTLFLVLLKEIRSGVKLKDVYVLTTFISHWSWVLCEFSNDVRKVLRQFKDIPMTIILMELVFCPALLDPLEWLRDMQLIEDEVCTLRDCSSKLRDALYNICVMNSHRSFFEYSCRDPHVGAPTEAEDSEFGTPTEGEDSEFGAPTEAEDSELRVYLYEILQNTEKRLRSRNELCPHDEDGDYLKYLILWERFHVPIPESKLAGGRKYEQPKILIEILKLFSGAVSRIDGNNEECTNAIHEFRKQLSTVPTSKKKRTKRDPKKKHRRAK